MFSRPNTTQPKVHNPTFKKVSDLNDPNLKKSWSWFVSLFLLHLKFPNRRWGSTSICLAYSWLLPHCFSGLTFSVKVKKCRIYLQQINFCIFAPIVGRTQNKRIIVIGTTLISAAFHIISNNSSWSNNRSVCKIVILRSLIECTFYRVSQRTVNCLLSL